ncbi:flagellar brake protein [Halobacillus aidingensis]|uniref:C-di-GMP-binding flagellar brake protein YcgR, contains PilZNR and PilZ domains n=1 Tax=Halobacillus aidingensis TaxID=240303 RepID=A0A1H0NR10_HALAD|nr:flagellar brake domain-containing protein [Halobacillus aidingensis]SDO95144.1 c-di-GMP-binding flagellar brake protein YcgR, contains PilZNR and PilZ domains [Halobacillus aidingensis]
MQNLKVGTPLTLELKKSEVDEVDHYKCKLVDFEDSKIYIDYPVHTKTGRTGFFLDGTQFQASFVGQDQSVYWFKTEVVAREKRNIPVIALFFPGLEELNRVQRRKYVRVNASVDVAIEWDTCSFPTITNDISGGGVMVVQSPSNKLEEENKIDLTLVLPMNTGETHYVFAIGKVIRVIPAKVSQPERVSIEFIEIHEKDRQLIIKYCFEQQMQSRMRALK